MVSNIVRLGPLAYVKYSYFPKNLSKCIYISYQDEFKGMKSLSLFLVRGFSTCNVQKIKPNVCCGYFNVKPKAWFRSYNFSSKNLRSTLKLHRPPSASYSSCIESSADYLLYQNLSESNSVQFPEEADSQAFDKSHLFQDEPSSTSSIPCIDINQKIQDERGSILASFWECVQPVSPSSDDIEIETSYMNHENESASSRKLDATPLLSSSDLVSSHGKILPTFGHIPFSQSTETLKVKTPNVKLNKECAEDEALRQSVLHCSPPKEVSPAGGGSPKELEEPPEQRLVKIYNKLSQELPLFFVKTIDYTIYSPDVVFENRIKGTTTVGIFPYMRQASFLRIVGHVKYAFIKLEILKITQHPEDNTIKVRWRMVGVSALKSLPMIFTLKAYTMKNAMEKMDEWYDGFSIFYVGRDGRIHKHVADKMIPDEELGVLKKPSLAERLAAVIGLAPKGAAHSQTAVTSSLEGLGKEKSDPVSSSMKSIVSFMVLGDYLDNFI